MSGLEPKTSAKVIINTSKGPLEIDLWAKELPSSSRVFIKKCIDGYYKGKEFDNVVKDLSVKVDALSDNINYDMKDEFHSRIRFHRRGILAAVKKDQDEANNHSLDSFFITLKETPDFNKRFIALGKVVGESLYTLAKLQNSEVDERGRVIYPARILDVAVPVKFFEDIEAIPNPSRPQSNHPDEPSKKKQKKSTKPKVKLQLGEDEEGETLDIRMKSAHELLNDRKLSKDIYEKKQHSKTPEKMPQKLKIAETGESDGISASPAPEETRAPSDGTTDEEENGTREKPARDPEVDSDYNSDLDLSAWEDIDIDLLHLHKLRSMKRKL